MRYTYTTASGRELSFDDPEAAIRSAIQSCRATRKPIIIISIDSAWRHECFARVSINASTDKVVVDVLSLQASTLI